MANDLDFKITFKGDRDLDRVLKQIGEEDGHKSLNKVCQDIAKDCCRRIVEPDAEKLVPVEEGTLERAIRTRVMKKSRRRVGATVGFADRLFQGYTYYGGFQEFGWTSRAGNEIEGEKYLRQALYQNATRVRGKYISDLRRWVKLRNSIPLSSNG